MSNIITREASFNNRNDGKTRCSLQKQQIPTSRVKHPWCLCTTSTCRLDAASVNLPNDKGPLVVPIMNMYFLLPRPLGIDSDSTLSYKSLQEGCTHIVGVVI